MSPSPNKEHAFHITSTGIRQGSIMNVLQFLSMDRASGCVSIGFGEGIPRAKLNLVNGIVRTAEFGAVKGNKVLCVLICQEASIADIAFEKKHHGDPENIDLLIQEGDFAKVLLDISKDVDTCPARPKLYGLLPLKIPDSQKPQPLLTVLHNFDMVGGVISVKPLDSSGIPLTECARLKEALAEKSITYDEQLVSLQVVAPLFMPLSPLSDREEEKLRKGLSSFLPHKRATNITLDGFWAFADILEGVAQERGNEVFVEVRNQIFELAEKLTGLDFSEVSKLRLQKQMERKRQSEWAQPSEKVKDESSYFQVQFDTGTFIRPRASGGYQIGEQDPDESK